MSFWSKFCKIILNGEKNGKIDERDANQISNCEIQLKKTCAQELCSEDVNCGRNGKSHRHPVSRNMSVSRSGRYKQKLRRKSVLFDVPELVSRNDINSSDNSNTSDDDKQVSQMSPSECVIESNECKSDHNIQVCDMFLLNS